MLVNIIHLISSFLWWSFIFMVIMVIRPSNKNGSLTVVLPKIRKMILYTSTISLISGFILLSVNINYQFIKLFDTPWGNLVLVSGLMSIIVYYNVISGGRKRLMRIRLDPNKVIDPMPTIMFSLITLSLVLMVVVSKVFLTPDF